MPTAALASRGFVWTDEEVQLLLCVTLNYKTTKCQEKVDWESCPSKYKDIHEDFVKQYPLGGKEDFPHSGGEVTSKAQITSKLKAVRTKYRKAVDTGKRSGQGRVVSIYFELCQHIWGGSPATETIAAGLETADDEDEVAVVAISRSSTPVSETPENSDDTGIDNGSSLEGVNTRRNTHKARLDGHRREKLKRKLHSDPAVEEDLRIKRRMLELAEEAEKNNRQQLDKLTSEMKNIHSSISEGLSMLRELMSLHNSPCHHADVHRLPSGFSSQLHYKPDPMQLPPSDVLPHGHSTPTLQRAHPGQAVISPHAASE